jgi:GNAT superfamily N-acetyltransferase
MADSDSTADEAPLTLTPLTALRRRPGRGSHERAAVNAIVFLANESYWARGLAAPAQQTAMAHSIAFGLYEGARQLGFARVLTDYGRLAYLGDVFVVEGARGQGLGKWLVECVLEHPALARVPRWLLGTADGHGLYERFGFVRAEAGRYMVRAEK